MGYASLFVICINCYFGSDFIRENITEMFLDVILAAPFRNISRVCTKNKDSKRKKKQNFAEMIFALFRRTQTKMFHKKFFEKTQNSQKNIFL